MLAQRSGEAAREIRDLIQTSVGQVESSASLIRSAGDGISAMAGGIHSVAASMSEIASSSNEQSTGLKEISGAVQQLDQITQDNAQMVGLAVQQGVDLGQLRGHALQRVQRHGGLLRQQGQLAAPQGAAAGGVFGAQRDEETDRAVSGAEQFGSEGLGQWGSNGTLDLEWRGDVVRATNTDTGEPLPRIC